ncbi:hypothetical protein [Herbaspirillum rubrisubalbicans]|uniref:hypothetical protein n=1 Tax=Herbaspirillum rubrisubalbicans TaxID=80842 RepID=UPI0015C52E39|nr:hypothetical protein [Herbaspirillum rubrisubalbicans]NQE51501.1 hypothetical protein [Herbaspirillum rubrisubalbicans]
MAPSLEEFIAVIGRLEGADEVLRLFNKFNTRPLVSSTPDEYNDPVGATKYYQFVDDGVECGFRGGIFTHAHFYIQEHEGYKSYKGKINGKDAAAWDLRSLTVLWGTPMESGGGKMDLLIGYIYPWILYDMSNHLIRVEFSQESIYMLTLMKK